MMNVALPLVAALAALAATSGAGAGRNRACTDAEAEAMFAGARARRSSRSRSRVVRGRTAARARLLRRTIGAVHRRISTAEADRAWPLARTAIAQAQSGPTVERDARFRPRPAAGHDADRAADRRTDRSRRIARRSTGSLTLLDAAAAAQHRRRWSSRSLRYLQAEKAHGRTVAAADSARCAADDDADGHDPARRTGRGRAHGGRGEPRGRAHGSRSPKAAPAGWSRRR